MWPGRGMTVSGVIGAPDLNIAGVATRPAVTGVLIWTGDTPAMGVTAAVEAACAWLANATGVVWWEAGRRLAVGVVRPGLPASALPAVTGVCARVGVMPAVAGEGPGVFLAALGLALVPACGTGGAFYDVHGTRVAVIRGKLNCPEVRRVRGGGVAKASTLTSCNHGTAETVAVVPAHLRHQGLGGRVLSQGRGEATTGRLLARRARSRRPSLQRACSRRGGLHPTRARSSGWGLVCGGCHTRHAGRLGGSWAG